MNSPPAHTAGAWPEGYRQWSGDFNDLVRTVGKIVAELNPGAKPPSASLIRHYQQIGCVGRGQKQGRSSTFGFDELFQAVASKDMAGSGVGLELTSQIMNNSAPAMRQAYSDPQPQKNGAQSLVERLLSQSQHEVHQTWQPMGAGGGAVSAFMVASAIGATPTLDTVPTRTLGEPIAQGISRHIKPCEGVDVYLAIDPANPDDRARAASALRAAADSIEQSPLSRSSKQ